MKILAARKLDSFFQALNWRGSVYNPFACYLDKAYDKAFNLRIHATSCAFHDVIVCYFGKFKTFKENT